MVRTIARQRLSDILVSKIRDFIIEKRLKPGDRLPTEQEMADQFGVSRMALREATKALGFLGIIESSPRRGLTVGTVAYERIIPLLGIQSASRNIPLEELVATRIVIETGALPYVMERMAADPTVYQRIRAINDCMQASNTQALWRGYDIAFHKALLEESGLMTLVAFGDLLEIFFQCIRENVPDSDWQEGAKIHLLIIEDVRKGNLPEAIGELRAHISARNKPVQEPAG